MAIRKLPPLLVNQIAAGEVIERPASVVKELIDNCLDAGARRVDVAVEEGGRQLIRISDDGCGIASEELPLAVAPHATSKLPDVATLAAIRTMGFRGEALASVASVSRLRMTSRVAGSEAGGTIEASGDKVSEVQFAGCSPGTVVEVRDLFFNVPARRKFLRGGPVEFGHVNEVVQRVAMVHPHVAFSLSHNGRKVLELPATESKRDRNIDVLGRELDEAMLEFELDELPHLGRARVWGLAGLPAIARATAKFQYTCVNGRPIRDRGIAHAIKEAYRGLIPPDKQPVAVVMVDIEPEAVDVNVHPTKAAVRFRDPSRIHSLVLSSLRQRLLGADLTPRTQLPTPGITDFRLPTDDDADRAFTTSATQPAENAKAFVDYFRSMAPQQKGFVYEEVKRALAEESPELITSSPDTAISGGSVAASAPAALRSINILQVHKSYVVTEDDQGIVIIDQHALHERVMFETLRDRVTGNSNTLESQRLLMPAIVDANPARMGALDELTPLLTRLGIEAQPIGPQQIAIHAFPSFLFDRKVDPVDFLADLLDRALEDDSPFATSGGGGEEAALHEVLDMMACKAAVKAGDALTDAELAALLQKRSEIERSGSCPHGRPTTIRLTLHDLEKHFKRT